MAYNPIKTQQIRDQAVTAAKIAGGAVTQTKIADAAVGTVKLANSSVTAIKMFSFMVGVAASSNQTIGVTPSARWYRMDTSSGNLTFTVGAVPYGFFIVENTGANNVLVSASGGGTINGSSSSITVPPGARLWLMNPIDTSPASWHAWFLTSIPASQLRQSLTPVLVVESGSVGAMTAVRTDAEEELTLTIPQASTVPGATMAVRAGGGGATSVTPASGTINGGGSIEMTAGTRMWLWSDGDDDWNAVITWP